MPKLVREKTQKIELRVTPETKILVLKMAQDDDITVTKFLEGLIQREFNPVSYTHLTLPTIYSV